MRRKDHHRESHKHDAHDEDEHREDFADKRHGLKPFPSTRYRR
jgi:hypothetical protein